MTIRTDIFNIGSSGLRAASAQLNSASNNIANVNTEGYSRERNTLVSSQIGGVVIQGVERIVDRFAIAQLRRDNSALEEASAFTENASRIDDILANEANSVAESLSRFYGALQTSVDEPTNIAARDLVLGQAGSVFGQIDTLETFLSNRESDLNQEINSIVEEANGLIQNIADLNLEIQVLSNTAGADTPTALLDARDQAILDLSGIVGISTRPGENSTIQVDLSSGQSLVLQDGTFNLFETNGDPDLNFTSLSLTVPDSSFTVPIGDEADVGGQLGGLFRFRNEVLSETQRDLGLIALTFADALNSQNNLGLDFDGQIGQDIFSIGDFQGLNYAANANPNSTVIGRIADGESDRVTSRDYRITVDNVVAGGPTIDVTIEAINPDGSPVLDSSGNAISQSLTGLNATAGAFNAAFDGIEIDFASGTSYTAGDQFLLQPSRNAGGRIDLALTRPEDLAYASPIRVESNIANLGDADISGSVVTNTLIGGATDSAAFTAAGGIQGPGASPTGGGGVGAPVEVFFTAADSFELRDAAGTVIVAVNGAANLSNVIAQGAATAGYPAQFLPPNRTDYPGYDISIEGVPRAGDRFTIAFNVDPVTGVPGVEDNRNGQQLTALETDDVVRRNNSDGFLTTGNPASNPSVQSLVGVSELYSIIVSDVGQQTARAQVVRDAAEVLQQQSRNRVDETSGVNLDEEAANLIRFQQAYSATARVISTAQSIFDSILNATG